jgi:uncharacterized protein (DUF58 family)
MDRAGLFKRIRKLLFRTDVIAQGMRAGNFRSAFKGRGAEFSEVRDYYDRDDARSIDWNVSARMGKPYVRVYREERELSIFLILDVSSSMSACGSPGSPFESGAMAASLLAWAAERNGDRVGFCAFDERVRSWFGLRKGPRHVMTVINAISGLSGDGRASRLGPALETVRRSMKKRGIIVLLSDFLSGGWEEEAGRTAAIHDLILIRTANPLEPVGASGLKRPPELPKTGSFSVRDPESGERLMASFGSAAFRKAYTEWSVDRCRSFRLQARAKGASVLEIGCGDDPAAKLIDFFARARRR